MAKITKPRTARPPRPPTVGPNELCLTEELADALGQWQSLPDEAREQTSALLRGELKLKRWLRRNNFVALTEVGKLDAKMQGYEAALALLEAAGDGKELR